MASTLKNQSRSWHQRNSNDGPKYPESFLFSIPTINFSQQFFFRSLQFIDSQLIYDPKLIVSFLQKSQIYRP